MSFALYCRLYRQFPPRVPSNESSLEFQMIKQHMDVEPGLGRTGSQQAAFQIAALGITLLVAIVGGLLVG